ncbi:ribosome-associated protein [Allopseudospirillum japonicum]|uniref:Ribosomal silencing factor RsfS n=1 Tax=Allopseudospirillum japonicum TaxID=64971 RepID=A0A1H6SU60_9GAMM|nr:ribosome silencing factor [Allopseudospirillum japonicum]SEI68307.1 ribosome-associated protein [Allopseudospirillum japonicum]
MHAYTEIPLNALAIEALEEIKAQNICLLDVRESTSVTDFMLIASGTSTRQLNALAQNLVLKMKEAGYRPLGVEGQNNTDWVLVDLGELVVHLMLPETRQFYDLERLWSQFPSETALSSSQTP